MNNLQTREKYLQELMELCIQQKLHPTELKGYIRKSYPRWKGDGLSTPSNLQMDTQRGLWEKYPLGYL